MKELPKKHEYIKDMRITGDRLYVAADHDMSCKDIVHDMGWEQHVVRVPGFLPEHMERGWEFSSEDQEELCRQLEAAGLKDFQLKTGFTDLAGGFQAENSGGKGVLDGAADQEGSGEDALLYHGPLDWDACPYHSLRQLILARKDSQQKILYIEADSEEERTYGQLSETAFRMAEGMKQQGIGGTDKLIFQFHSNRRFIEAFWACMVLGAGVAPVNKPADYETRNLDTDKLAAIAGSFGRTVILTDPESREALQQFAADRKLDSRVFTCEELLESAPDDWDMETAIGDQTGDEERDSFDKPCLFLFTSGSTGTPKGVGLSPRNIFARNLGEIQMYDLDESLVDCNWMTLTHAAGLIWSHIRDVDLDAFQAQIQTDVILQDPLKLPMYFDRFQATTSWAPNFAYAMVANAVDETKDYGWDLCRMTNLYSGGEMNVSRSLRAFLRKLRKYGLAGDCLIPCFGMTETASCITYENNFHYETTTDSLPYVPVGTPALGIQVRIAGQDGQTLKKGETGYLQLKGDTIITRYYENPEADRTSFSDDGFLITGDLAFIEGDSVTITGREKDVIIVNGENHYVQDLEEAAEALEAVEGGFSAASSVMENGKEAVLLFFTPSDPVLLEASNRNQLKKLLREIKKAVQIQCFVTLDHLIPVSREKFPRSEIGKKQRNQLKNAYLDGAYEKLLGQLEERKTEYVMERQYVPVELGAEADWEDKGWTCLMDFSFATEEARMRSGTWGSNEETAEADVEQAYEAALGFLKKFAEVRSRTRVIVPVIIQNKGFDILAAILPSLIRTFSLEQPNVRFKLVFTETLDRELLEQECRAADEYDAVWYRDDLRQIDCYKTVECICKKSRTEELFSDKIAVVFGGFGGIGKLMCRYILEQFPKAKVLVTGRRKAEGIIDILQEFDPKRLHYEQADVCDYETLEAACEATKTAWGLPLGCLFHLAARSIAKEEELSILDTIRKKRQDLYRESAAVKLQGLINGDRIRRANECCMYVFGSVAGQFGMIHMGAYGAANLLAEKYCEFCDDEKLRYVGWSGWSNIGMNLKKTADDMKIFLNDFDMERNGFLQGFTAEGGIRMLDHILESGVHAVYAGMDREFDGIRHLINDKQRMTLELVCTEAEDLATGRQLLQQTDWESRGVEFRYHLNEIQHLQGGGTSQLQEAVERIWKNALELDTIRMDENLFDAGGNSLTVFKIVSDLKSGLSLDVTPVDIMMYSTIQSFVEYIESREASADGSQADPANQKMPGSETQKQRGTEQKKRKLKKPGRRDSRP